MQLRYEHAYTEDTYLENNKLEYKEPNAIKRWTCIYRRYLPRAYLYYIILLHLSLYFRRKSSPLQPLTALDLVFFLAFWEHDIESYVSLWFQIQICDLRSCSIPLCPLSNSTCLTWFGFFNAKLCPISHNDLIMD